MGLSPKELFLLQQGELALQELPEVPVELFLPERPVEQVLTAQVLTARALVAVSAVSAVSARPVVLQPQERLIRLQESDQTRL